MSSSETNKAQSSLPKPPNVPARSAPQGTASARPESFPVNPPATTGTSVIGNDLVILGEKITLISQNCLQVDGHVHGDIHGKQVLISKVGSVTGNVYAEKIEVCGGVRGPIRALTVALHESAKVDGDILHQTLSISKGAELNGRVRRTKDKNHLIPVLDAEACGDQSGKDSDLRIRGCTQISARGKRESNKDLVRAFYKRGNAYGRKGVYDRAIADYTNAIKIDPKHVSSYVNRATNYDQKGDYDRAIADYTKAIEIRPDDAVVYLKRGLVYRERGDMERALADFNKSVKHASADFSYAYFLRGLFHDDMGQFDRAIADYTKAIEIEPGLAAFYQSRAEAYAKKGDAAKAEGDFAKAKELKR